MTTPEKQYAILWEYDKPISIYNYKFLNYTSGIWQFIISPAKDGVITITDDRGITGYFRYNNSLVYDVRSLTVDAEQYNRVYNYANLISTNKSFYYESSTTRLLVHFDLFNPPIVYTDIIFGATVGYSKGIIGDNKPYFNNIYYEPRVDKVFNIKKSKDELFYGLLKYTTGNVSCINEDGHFDDWRDRNLFAQASRILIGQSDDDYEDFYMVFQGLIEDDSRSWSDFSVKLQDPRKGLTQPVATNLLNQTDYPSLSDDNIDKPKPVQYGLQVKSKCICLNETQTATYYTFLMCDTEYNDVNSILAVYVDGGEVSSITSSSLTNGTFVLSGSATAVVNGETITVADNLGSVTATYYATESHLWNGVDILKDLMYRYDNKNYISTFWDLTETNAAGLLSRNTSVSIKDNKKLQDIIEQVCVDIDGIFFSKNDGTYTIRIYDENRIPIKTINQDEWTNAPSIENNGSEFLSSVIIKYFHNQDDGSYRQYENKTYEDEVFDVYRTLKSITIETNLPSLALAQDKSESIMSISKSVGDIITRSIPYTNDIEIMDFIIASPHTRLTQTPEYGIYEVLGINHNLSNFEVDLTMRFVEDYIMPVDTVFNVLIDESGNFIIDESGNTILIRG